MVSQNMEKFNFYWRYLHGKLILRVRTDSVECKNQVTKLKILASTVSEMLNKILVGY